MSALPLNQNVSLWQKWSYRRNGAQEEGFNIARVGAAFIFFAWPPDRLTRFLFARRELMGAIYCHLSPVTDLGERYVTLWRLTLLLQAVERDKFG